MLFFRNQAASFATKSRSRCLPVTQWLLLRLDGEISDLCGLAAWRNQQRRCNREAGIHL